ncbi:MAG: FHA domain-containing protein [Kofleriaceae bacterium]
MAQILWRDAQGIEGTVQLGAAEVRIGRAVECAIRSDDAMVSRLHAKVAWGGGGWVLEDLGSANGVFFQEQRIKSHLFKHGDAVRCGSLWLRFVDDGVAPVDTPAAVAPAAVAPAPVAAAPAAAEPARASDADQEIRVLRRRLEQMQTELRVFRSNKFSPETVRKLEDVEADLTQLEIERDHLRGKVTDLEAVLAREAGSVKVQRALEIASKSAETAAALTDLLSSVRIEVMAAEGEFDQFAQQLPRASFELIRQSLRDAAEHVDRAREVLRTLRQLSE